MCYDGFTSTSSQAPLCVCCGAKITDLTLHWSNKEGGYVCEKCLAEIEKTLRSAGK